MKPELDSYLLLTMIKAIIARCGHLQHPVRVMRTGIGPILALLLVSALAAIPASEPSAAKRAEDPGIDARIDSAGLAQRMHQLVNTERRRQGLASLAWDERLAAIARDHSIEMAANGRLDHVSSAGLDPRERAERAGYRCRKQRGNTQFEGFGENLFLGQRYQAVGYRRSGGRVTREYYGRNSAEDIAHAALDTWMHSPGHRRNLLERRYDRQGIGVAVGREGQVYITEDLC